MAMKKRGPTQRTKFSQARTPTVVPKEKKTSAEERRLRSSATTSPEILRLRKSIKDSVDRLAKRKR